MPRQPRNCPAGSVYHIWNRAAGRLRLFKKEADYVAFEKIIVAAHALHPIPILDWCLMPNHWHFVVYPNADDQVTSFFRWLTHTHAMRVNMHRAAVGTGPLYQGRFKSLPVQRDEHLATLLRYVQRNPVRAKLVDRASRWKHTGHIARQNPGPLADVLSPWPIKMPADWDEWVNKPQTQDEIDAIRLHIQRGRPFGSATWMKKTAGAMDLEFTMRPFGRPKSAKTPASKK